MKNAIERVTTTIITLFLVFLVHKATAEGEPTIIAKEPIEITAIQLEDPTEPTEEAETETETAAPEVTSYFDVPLSHELQDFIFAECEIHNIAPEIILAIIEQESTYKADAIGDHGQSFGLMQIQAKWHQERMKRLGCKDLLNPYENIKVGVDLFADLMQHNAQLEHALMAYNGGQAYADKLIASGNISNYASEVINRAEKLKESFEN